METSIMTPKGQVVVPKKLRSKYGIKPGVKVAFIEKDGDLIIKALDKDYFANYAGLLSEGENLIEELMREKKKEREK